MVSIGEEFINVKQANANKKIDPLLCRGKVQLKSLDIHVISSNIYIFFQT